jgi:glycosyltransferase involved in cell wall biosynthesis
MPKNTSEDLKDKQFAILHAFFKADCKGGGEKTSLILRNYYNADLFTGFVGFETWKPDGEDTFSKMLFDKNYKLTIFHEESNLPYWRKIKRQLAFWQNGHKLNGYDAVIFAGNIGLAVDKITTKNTKKILYCYTPPRPFTDQLENRLKEMPSWQRPLMKFFAKIVNYQYENDTRKMDLVVADSENVKERLKKFYDINSVVIYPPVDTEKFNWISQGDYFISYARLEPLKRIPLILDAFEKMPDKKLVMCSSGPLKDWVNEEIERRGLKNVVYEGLVSDERLFELVGNALAGVYIPVDEDAGIIQCEIMSAGKPVIGVDEGGLRETILDGKTGVLIPKNPTVDDLVKAVKEMTPKKALEMKEACIEQSKQFDTEIFYQKFDEEIEKLF